MSTATKGRAGEHDASKALRASGYTVTRAAGSKGYVDCVTGIVKCDLIATKRGRKNEDTIQMILLQVKREAL